MQSILASQLKIQTTHYRAISALAIVPTFQIALIKVWQNLFTRNRIFSTNIKLALLYLAQPHFAKISKHDTIERESAFG